jgi:hypothetical protein
MVFEFYSTESCAALDFNQCCEGIRNRADLVVFYQFFQRKLMAKQVKNCQLQEPVVQLLAKTLHVDNHPQK